MENLDLGALQEGVASGTEVSEEEKRKVQEDGRAAQQAHQQVKANQQKNQEVANFLSQIIKRYFSNEKIVNYIASSLHRIFEMEDKLKVIFSPFLEGQKLKISEYIEYLKSTKIGFDKIDLMAIKEAIEFEKLNGEEFWSALKNNKEHYKEFIENLEKELLKN